MSRYVDVEPLDVVGTKGVSKDYADGMAYVLDLLDNLPIADVKPVRHGQWKEVLAGMDYEYECTRCKACVEQEYPYCPNCGARMDGESKRISKYIDAEELIRWIKESQQMTSKVRAIIAKILVMEEKEQEHE